MRGALEVRGQHPEVPRIHRLAHPPVVELAAFAEQTLGAPGEIRVEGPVERDEHRDRPPLDPPPGAPGLLEEARDRAREPQVDGRVEVADVDAELESVGRGDAAEATGK